MKMSMKTCLLRVFHIVYQFQFRFQLQLHFLVESTFAQVLFLFAHSTRLPPVLSSVFEVLSIASGLECLK